MSDLRNPWIVWVDGSPGIGIPDDGRPFTLAAQLCRDEHGVARLYQHGRLVDESAPPAGRSPTAAPGLAGPGGAAKEGG